MKDIHKTQKLDLRFKTQKRSVHRLELQRLYHRRKVSERVAAVIKKIAAYGRANAIQDHYLYGYEKQLVSWREHFCDSSGRKVRRHERYWKWSVAPCSRQKLLDYIRSDPDRVQCKVEDYYEALRNLPYWIRVTGTRTKMAVYVRVL